MPPSELLHTVSFHRPAHGCIAIATEYTDKKGLLRELNPGPLAPEARIMPLDQAANATRTS